VTGFDLIAARTSGANPGCGDTSLQIIAEGVETAFQVETHRTAGVQLAQGHYFSAPRSASDFKRFYADNA